MFIVIKRMQGMGKWGETNQPLTDGEILKNIDNSDSNSSDDSDDSEKELNFAQNHMDVKSNINFNKETKFGGVIIDPFPKKAKNKVKNEEKKTKGKGKVL